MTAPLVSLDDIQAARQAIRSFVHFTPTMSSAFFGRQCGARVVLKLELFQKTGSFKVRGVVNTLRQLDADAIRRGVISLSAGNHAQALAWGASRFNTRATIVMPSTALASKVAATREYGGEVVQTSGDLLATAQELQRARNLTMVHPFDDARMIAGHGSLGLEILEQVPDVHTVVIACGGGGLISGVAAAIKQHAPHVRVVGVEPAGADAMTRSLAAGAPQKLDRLDTIADGLAAPFAGAITFAHCKKFVDDWFVVADDDIRVAMKHLMERCKLMAEPAAATALVPLLSAKLGLGAHDTVVPIVCGGNVDLARLKEML